MNTENIAKTLGKSHNRQVFFTIYLTTASLKRRDFVTYLLRNAKKPPEWAAKYLISFGCGDRIK